MTLAEPPARLRAQAAPRSGFAWAVPAFALAVVLLPFLASGSFPSQDGPAHLHTAGLLAGLRDGTAPVAAVFLEEVSPGPTNLAAYWLLSRLMEALAPARAEWAMALLLSLLLLASLAGAVRLAGGGAASLLPALPLAAPIMLHMGSFALVLAMAPAFLALGCAARWLRGGGGGGAALAGFGALGLLACALQIQVAVPLLAAVGGGALAGWGWRGLAGAGWWPPGRLVGLCLAALPVAAAALAYGLLMPPGHAGQSPRWEPLRQAALLGLRGEVAWFSLADPAVLALAGLVLALAALAWAWRGPRAAGGAAGDLAPPVLLGGAAAIAAAALVLPLETAAVPQVPQRLLPFAQLLLALWFAATPLPAGWRRAVLACAAAAALVTTLSRAAAHVAVADRLGAALAAAEARIAPGSVVAYLRLPSVLDEKYPAQRFGGLMLRFDPTTHLGRGIATRDVVALSNYQLMPVWDIFRVRLRAEVVAAVASIAETSVMVRRGDPPGGLPAFQAALRGATGRQVDTIILWTGGMDAAAAASRNPHLAAMLEQLHAGFLREAASDLVEVWRRMTPP